MLRVILETGHVFLPRCSKNEQGQKLSLMNKQMKNTLTKVLIFFVLLVGAYCLWCHFLTDNVIWTKLKVNGIAIQGMTEEEAIIAITGIFRKIIRTSR